MCFIQRYCILPTEGGNGIELKLNIQRQLKKISISRLLHSLLAIEEEATNKKYIFYLYYTSAYMLIISIMKV